jgi:hypothetical protein
MRARIIKPSFFINEDLATLPYEARLLFIGLWCVADREGRLEDRPRRLKAELFPYDDIELDPLLSQLAELGFIVRYEAQGKRYIQITNFTKHQRLHPNEAPSTIPPPPDPGSREDGGLREHVAKNGQRPASDAGAADSHHGDTYSHLGDTDDAPCDDLLAPRCDALNTMVVPARTSTTSTSTSTSNGIYSCALSRAEAAGTDVPPQERTPRREKDALFETLVEVCYGLPYGEVTFTPAERGRINAAVKQLRAVGATPEDVRERAARYRARWPGVDLTPTALAANWQVLANGPPRPHPPKRSSLEIALQTLAKIRAEEGRDQTGSR